MAPALPEQQKFRATESFFGRRKGKALQGRKQRLIDEMLPSLLLDPNAASPTNLADIFKDEKQAYRLEIGFGGGEHLAHQAEQNPEIGFIGIEPFINGMAKMLGEIEDRDLTNVRLYNDDATQILDWLPADCLDQVDLLYPDPWPKKRNWKRRFVNGKNLTRIARVLRPNGLFRFASDIDTYVNWTLSHIDNQGDFRWLAETASDWHDPWDGWIRTRYEAKAVREGRTPAYLEFRLR